MKFELEHFYIIVYMVFELALIENKLNDHNISPN